MSSFQYGVSWALFQLQQQCETTASDQSATGRFGQLRELGSAELCGAAVNQTSRVAKLHQVPHRSPRKQHSSSLSQQSRWRLRIGVLSRDVEGAARKSRAAENRLSGDAKQSSSVSAQCKCHNTTSCSWSHDHIQGKKVIIFCLNVILSKILSFSNLLIIYITENQVMSRFWVISKL